MKRICCMILIVAVLCSVPIAFASEGKQCFEAGNYTYELPDYWDTELGVDNMVYHYENGDALSGKYIMSNVSQLDREMSSADALATYAKSFFDGFIDILISESFSNINYIEYALPAIGEFPSLAFECQFDAGVAVLDILNIIWMDNDYFYAFTYSDYGSTKESIIDSAHAWTDTIKSKNQLIPNSRKNPATVGQTVIIKAAEKHLEYTLSATVDEFFRGNDYINLVGSAPKTPSEGCEYVAVKVTVKFESIDYINAALLGTDDPQIDVDSIFDFNSFTSDGSEYDNVHYSINGFRELKSIYEGASTTGYFQFEIYKDDPAPLLVYEPVYKNKVWFTLR